MGIENGPATKIISQIIELFTRLFARKNIYLLNYLSYLIHVCKHVKATPSSIT